MIGSLIGAALGAAGSIYGGLRASQAMREAKKSLEAQRQENTNWYNRNYNQDATQRADAQRILEITRERMARANRAAAGHAAVAGGTEESLAATKAANAQAMGDAAAQIAAAGAARKDAVENKYLQRQDALRGQQRAMEAQRAQSIAQAAQGMASAGASLADAFTPDEASVKTRGADASGTSGRETASAVDASGSATSGGGGSAAATRGELPEWAPSLVGNDPGVLLEEHALRRGG